MSDKNKKKIVYSEPGGYFSKEMLEALNDLKKAKGNKNSDVDEKEVRV